MTFDEALKILNIEKYKESIWNSSSNGELFFIMDYINMAKIVKKQPEEERIWFPLAFEMCEEFARKNWKRPESWYQHMPKMISSLFKKHD